MRGSDAVCVQAVCSVTFSMIPVGYAAGSQVAAYLRTSVGFPFFAYTSDLAWVYP